MPAAHRACRALPGVQQGMTLISEMAGPWGIPDLTAVVGRKDLINARLSSPVAPLLHEVDAAVTAVAHPKRAATPAQFARALSWPEETVRRRLTALRRSGALLAVGDDRFVRDPSLQPLGRLYAIEAKVRDWRKALNQVRGYTVWADSYVLVMGPLSADARAELLREVSADGAGLVLDGRWLRRPSVHPIAPAKRLWASEHVIAALRG